MAGQYRPIEAVRSCDVDQVFIRSDRFTGGERPFGRKCGSPRRAGRPEAQRSIHGRAPEPGGHPLPAVIDPHCVASEAAATRIDLAKRSRQRPEGGGWSGWADGCSTSTTAPITVTAGAPTPARSTASASSDSGARTTVSPGSVAR